MAATPRKLVHWDMDGPSISALDSPFFNNTYESSVVSTSSLEFINSQLVAHGFVPSPGLSLEGISNDDSTRVVKCLLGMLSQRVEDMSRTEDLTAKFRTLSYDHERMLSMYRTANERAANAERETNLHKSRLTTALKNLQASENAHKQTSAELQRTRTSLQGVRATHIAELKKKEKDTERMMEKWQKLADSQVKLSVAPSGMRCANVAVVDGSEILGPKYQGYLEIALEEAEQARASLGNETLHLRKLLLSTVNELQSVLHQAQNLLPDNESLEAPTPFTLTTLFPLSPPTAASDKLNSVLAGLRQTLTTLSQPTTKTCTSKLISPIPDGEVERLQGIITTLKEEISRSQKQSVDHAAETQAMFDKFAKDHRIATGEIGEMSIELMSAPLRDVEKERLDSLRQELDSERQRFTEAAIKFGREKAALEAERLKFLDEKRSWQVEMMLAEFPPTPVPASPIRPTASLYKFSPKKSPHKSPHRSPRKSPAKSIVGKIASPNGGRKAHRASKRSLASPSKVIISYETELIPPIAALSFPSAKSLAPSLTSSLLPTSFVLPPPSPRASLPTKPALPPAMPNSPPETAVSQTQISTTSSSDSASTSPEIKLMPSTPPAIRYPFPVAKPFAPRMIHAYSPARPSPLSRILMLSDSPLSPPRNGAASDDSLSPTNGPLAVVLEEDDGGELGSQNEVIQTPPEPEMSLAAELGVESPPDTPLHEKVEPNIVVNSNNGLGLGRVFHPDPNAKKPPAAQSKGKSKEDSLPRTRTSAEGEKENNSRSNQKTLVRKSGKISPAMSGGNIAATRKISPTNEPRKPVAKSAAKPTSTTASATTSRTKPFTKPSVPPNNSGGARRVLINSADAPPIGKGRKG
ncbi:hypothetical protein BYT27DRAFT_7338870 [Phlegmacium glaucopus]|nr:hypothetical protein BYT27DRAFT_7338870 [Phlegmacium glaucopus]